jgi:hypothetical protein
MTNTRKSGCGDCDLLFKIKHQLSQYRYYTH